MDWIKRAHIFKKKDNSCEHQCKQQGIKFTEFESKRLIFRKFHKNDFPVVLTWHSDPENMGYRRDGVKSVEEVHIFLNWVISEANSEECKNFWFAVVEKDSNKLLGEAILNDVPDKPEIGWLVDKKHWGNGIGTEIGASLLYYAFDILKLRRVIAACHVENHASYKLMEKIGMRREARFVKEKLYGDTWCDRYQYAILREEWEK